MSNYRFSNKEFVTFSYGGVDGCGIITGVATNEVPILGVYYIIQVLSSNKDLPNEEYPFGSIAMPEIGILRLQVVDTMERVDDIPIYRIHLGEHLACAPKARYLHALRQMPEPERTRLVGDLVDDMFKTGLPTKITRPHLFELMRWFVCIKL